jgi:hypothetical protein
MWLLTSYKKDLDPKFVIISLISVVKFCLVNGVVYQIICNVK